MGAIIILERSSKHFARFMELLSKEPTVRIKDVRKIISHSSYYAIIMKKLYALNKLLEEINPEFYLAKPDFDMTKTKEIYTALKKCELVKIELRKDFFILRYPNETKK